MDSETIYVFSIIAFGYLAYVFSKKYKKNKAKKVFRLFLDYLNDYELETLKSFDSYLASHKILIYKNNESKIIEKDKFIKANIQEAFSDIKSKLSSEIKQNLYLYGEEVKNEYLKKLNSIFYNSNIKDKLDFVNKKIEVLAIDVAIENYHSTNENNHNKSLGAEFIALVAFQNEILLGYSYPEKNYNHLKKLLKLRKENPFISFQEFLDEINYL